MEATINFNEEVRPVPNQIKYRITEEFKVFLGIQEDEITKGEAQKRIMDYARRNNMLKVDDNRTIIVNTALASLFKLKEGQEISMFQIQKYLNKHIIYSSEEGTRVSFDDDTVTLKRTVKNRHHAFSVEFRIISKIHSHAVKTGLITVKEGIEYITIDEKLSRLFGLQEGAEMTMNQIDNHLSVTLFR